MNKSFFNILTTANTALLVVILILYFFRDNRVVYVDSLKLMNGYAGMQEARKSYQQKAAAWKANIDTLTSELQRLIMRHEKETARMTSKEQQLSEELIRSKQNQLRQYQQATNSQAQEQDARMTADVVNEVNAFLKKYGEEKGYTIIMAATEYGNIAYADEDLDITDEVLEKLNKQYSGR